MKRLPAALTAVLLAVPIACRGTGPVSGAVPALSPEQRVEALFAAWNKPDRPGAAIQVIRDGKVILRKAYGMADIERGVPITVDTVFNIASTSKQFTAFAIHLLAQDGQLSLDDDMRKHLPEMHDFGSPDGSPNGSKSGSPNGSKSGSPNGKPVTIRDLMEHTSGLRDSSNLMLLAGWRPDDVTTPDDMLAMLRQQRELNFEPGTEHLYSNGGYVLLAAIVQRVSGKSLADFASERIFGPLGMQRTRFQTDYGDLVPGRALSYRPAPGGRYKYVSAAKSAPGASEVLTTLDDLARWDRNFDDARVGGKALLEQMQKPGVLKNGQAFNYGAGLYVETYRGARVISHLGSVAGFASQVARFPDQRLSVMVLANSPDLTPTAMMRKIADIYLEANLAPRAAAPVPKQFPAEVKVDPATLDALAGYYAFSPEFGFNITAEDGRLLIQGTGQPKIPLFASSASTFFTKAVDAQLRFDAPGEHGGAPRFVLQQHGKEQVGVRAKRPVVADGAVEGAYYSDELRVLYRIERKEGRMVLTHPRGERPLEFSGGSIYFAGGGFGVITFDCATPDRCTGFRLNDLSRTRNLRFNKVVLVAPGAQPAAEGGVPTKTAPAGAAQGAAPNRAAP